MAYQGKYKTEDGTKAPSVTTIISGNLGWNKRMLMAWQNRMWETGVDPRKISKAASDIGTVTHDMIESYVFGENTYEPDDGIEPDIVIAASDGLSQYIEWSEKNKVEYLESEIRMVSERYKYGGTADAIVKIDGDIYLVDFKTSKGVYTEHLVQLAAYRQMIYETTDYEIAGCIVIKIDKEPGVTERIHPYYIPNHMIDLGWETFEKALDLHNMNKSFSKYLRELSK